MMSSHLLSVANFRALNAIQLIGVSLILMVAFYYQLAMSELPCPLCLLQRLGLMGIGLGFLLNMRFSPRPSHYAVSIVFAVLLAVIALRQVSLHVTGTGGYGSTVLGMHMYSWDVVVALIAVVYTALLMGVPHQYRVTEEDTPRWVNGLIGLAFVVFVLVVGANVVSILFECGFQACPDNPENYLWLK